MREALIVALALAGCGFTTGGRGTPSEDVSDAAAGGGDANTDAAVPDGTTIAACPATYAPILALATSTSRYRFVATAAKWIDGENDCADDASGGELATHLIVLDDAAEKTAMIGGIVGGLNLNDQWAGATDLAEEGEARFMTTQATTLALTPSMQADDKDCIRIKNNAGNEEYRDCDEVNKYVCECDGRAADPARFPNLPDGNGNN